MKKKKQKRSCVHLWSYHNAGATCLKCGEKTLGNPK